MGNKIRLAYEVQSDSIVDGPGIRTVIWTQGCSHNCKGCHNPESHSFTDGKLYDVEDVKKEIDKYINTTDGVTFSGGDPMFQPIPVTELAKYAKSKGLNVWCYTGFTYEQVVTMAKHEPIYMELLKNIDVLVDGKFELENRHISLIYRGSTNQRIIDVKKSLEEKRVITDPRYEEKVDIMYHTPVGIFI